MNCEQNVVKFAGKWGKCIEKCNFYIKYFDKINYADRPYLLISELKPETHIYIFWPNVVNLITRTEVGTIVTLVARWQPRDYREISSLKTNQEKNSRRVTIHFIDFCTNYHFLK